MLLPTNPSHEFQVGLFNLDQLPSPTPKIIVNQDHADFLNITGLRSDPVITEQNCIIKVLAEQIKNPTYPDCACTIKEVKAHSPFLMNNVLDLPRARKSVLIDIKRQRWMCKTCSKTVTQPLDIMTEDHYRMTGRLVKYCEEQALLGTELSLAEETGISPRTIRSIRKKMVKKLKEEIVITTPRVLGLDGVRADLGRRRVIFTNIEAGEVLDLIMSGEKESIKDRIWEFPGFESIAIVTIDMCRTLLAAVRAALPNAIIIIDGFHIIRTANQSMDKVRNRLFPREKKKREPGVPTRPRPEPFRKRRKQLTKNDKEYMQFWFDQQRELKLAYDLKEDYMEMLDMESYGCKGSVSSVKAKNFYQNWLSSFPVGEAYNDLLKDFKPILSAMKNWGEYIFNRFDHNFTNAYTESMNRKIKDILRESRGCSFETLHAKIVYGTRLRKEIKENRETEMMAVRPRAKRGPRTGANSQNSATARTTQGVQSSRYDLPDVSQIAFKFSN